MRDSNIFFAFENLDFIGVEMSIVPMRLFFLHLDKKLVHTIININYITACGGNQEKVRSNGMNMFSKYERR